MTLLAYTLYFAALVGAALGLAVWMGRVYPDFKYGDSIVSVGAAGQVWDEAALAAYVADPGAWLKQATGDAGAKTKMTFKLPKGGEDLAAYLASLN